MVELICNLPVIAPFQIDIRGETAHYEGAGLSGDGTMNQMISWESQGVVVTYSNQLHSKALARIVRDIQSDPHYDNLRYVIHDCSLCTGADYSVNDLLELAATDGVAARTNLNVRVAMVATQPEIVDLTKTYLSFGLNLHEVKMFSTIHEARMWVMTPP